MVENTVGKAEIACYKQFLFFPQCFQKICTADTSKPGLVWDRVNLLTQTFEYRRISLKTGHGKGSATQSSVCWSYCPFFDPLHKVMGFCPEQNFQNIELILQIQI